MDQSFGKLRIDANMTDFEFVIRDDNEMIPKLNRKKLVLAVTELGFNLLDENGFAIINASLIRDSGEFGVNQGNVGTLNCRVRQQSTWGQDHLPRTDYRITEAE